MGTRTRTRKKERKCDFLSLFLAFRGNIFSGIWTQGQGQGYPCPCVLTRISFFVLVLVFDKDKSIHCLSLCLICGALYCHSYSWGEVSADAGQGKEFPFLFFLQKKTRKGFVLSFSKKGQG